MLKQSLPKNNNSTTKPELGVREVLPFPRGIRVKVNVIVRLMFELTNYDVTAQHVSYYPKVMIYFRVVVGEKKWMDVWMNCCFSFDVGV